MKTKKTKPNLKNSSPKRSTLTSACYAIIIFLALGLLAFEVINRSVNKTETAERQDSGSLRSLTIIKEDINPINPGLFTDNPGNLNGKDLRLIRDLKERNRYQSDKIVFLTQKITALEETLDDIKADLFRKNSPESDFQIASLAKENNEKEKQLREFSALINDTREQLSREQTSLNEALKDLKTKKEMTQELNERLNIALNELEAEKFFSGELKNMLESSTQSQNRHLEQIEKYEEAINGQETQIAELLAKIYDLSSSIEAQSSLNNELQESLQNSSAQNDTLKKELENNENLLFQHLQELSAYKDKLREQQKELEEFRSQSAVAVTNMEEEFISQIDSLSKELSQKEEDISNLQISLKNQEDQLNELKEQLASASSSSAATIAESELFQKIYDLTLDMESQANLIETLQENLDKESLKNRALKKGLKESGLRIQQQIAENAAHQEQWAERQRELDELKNQHLSLSSELETVLSQKIAELEKELTENRNYLEADREELDNRNREIGALYENLEANENQISDLLEKINLLTSEIQAKNALMDELEKSREAAETETNNLRKELTDSLEHIHQYIQETTRYREELSLKNNELMGLNSALVDSRQELDNLRQKLSATASDPQQIYDYQSRVAELEERVKDLNILEGNLIVTEEENRSLKNELAKNVWSVQRHIAEAASLKEQLPRKQEKIEKLKDQKSSLKKTLKDRGNEYKRRIKEKKAAIKNADSELSRLMEDIASKSTVINNLEGVIEASSAKNRELKKQLANSSAEMHKYLQETSIYREKCAEQQQQSEDFKSGDNTDKTATLLQEITQLEKAAVSEAEEIARLQSIMEEKEKAAERRINELNAQISSLVADLDIEKSRFSALQKENENILRDNERLEKEIRGHKAKRQKMIEAIDAKRSEIENLLE